MHMLPSPCVHWQEWATSQNIVLPHRENRANAAIVYKEEEEAPAQQTNILQARFQPRPLPLQPAHLGALSPSESTWPPTSSALHAQWLLVWQHATVAFDQERSERAAEGKQNPSHGHACCCMYAHGQT